MSMKLIIYSVLKALLFWKFDSEKSILHNIYNIYHHLSLVTVSAIPTSREWKIPADNSFLIVLIVNQINVIWNKMFV